jgi:uncharacterized protein
MLKVLIIALAVALLLWLLFGRAARQGKPPRGSPPRHAGGDAEEMVTCAHCGVHLPRSEALAARSLHYCSAAHRDVQGDVPPRD